jgi:hypothetical protein
MITLQTKKKTKKRRKKKRRILERKTKPRAALAQRALILHLARSLRVLRRANHSRELALQHSLSLAETSLPARSSRRMSHRLLAVGLVLLCHKEQPLVELWVPDPVATERPPLAKCQMALCQRGRS